MPHKTAECHGPAPSVNRWYGMAGCQHDDLIAMGKKKTVAAHVARVSPLLNKVRKRRLDLVRGTCIHEPEVDPVSTRRNLYLCHFGLRVNGVGRVSEVSDQLGRRAPCRKVMGVPGQRS